MIIVLQRSWFLLVIERQFQSGKLGTLEQELVMLLIKIRILVLIQVIIALLVLMPTTTLTPPISLHTAPSW
jgi:hypothetical protein